MALAADLRLGRCRIRQRDVRLACAGSAIATKEQVALGLVGRFPELALRLPPHRKAWMSEDYRMAIFDAVGLGVTAFSPRRGQKAVLLRDVAVDKSVLLTGSVPA